MNLADRRPTELERKDPGIWDEHMKIYYLRVVQLLSRVLLSVNACSAARQPPLSLTISRSLLKLTSIESVMPSNHLILCCPLLLLPSILPSITVFPSELALGIRRPEYWSFSLKVPSPFLFCSENPPSSYQLMKE